MGNVTFGEGSVSVAPVAGGEWTEVGYCTDAQWAAATVDPATGRGDILELIDNAVDGLCACGCGTRLASDGPSAWFATEDCQGRWQGGGRIDAGAVESGLGQMLIQPFVITEWQLQLLREAFNDLGQSLAGMLQPFADAMAQLQPLVPEDPPEDPMARALWLRRNRNTGPKSRQRAPRRIDARGAR